MKSSKKWEKLLRELGPDEFMELARIMLNEWWRRVVELQYPNARGG